MTERDEADFIAREIARLRQTEALTAAPTSWSSTAPTRSRG